MHNKCYRVVESERWSVTKKGCTKIVLQCQAVPISLRNRFDKLKLTVELTFLIQPLDVSDSGLLLQTAGVVQNVLNACRSGFQFCLVQLLVCGTQLFVLSLQFAIAKKGFVNLLRLLFRGLAVYKPDQIVLGKGLCHRRYGF